MFRVLSALWLGLLSAFSSRVSLALHVAALEQQLATLRARGVKPRISIFDRLFWVALLRWWSRWRDALVFVQPSTVIGWHRMGFRLWWRWRCRAGRPPIEPEVIRLILRISADNPGWGHARIAAELAKNGFDVAVETVRKYALRSTTSPSPTRRGGQSWKTFLRNQASAILACDFLVQHTAGFGQLYVFVVMSIETRKVVCVNVTANPSLLWVQNQLREVFSPDHPWRFLIHDNDGIFGQLGAPQRKQLGVRCTLDLWLERIVGVRGIPTPYHAPNANAFVERFNRVLREEALNHFVFFGQRHLLSVVRRFVDFYNHARPSQGIGAIPEPRDGPPSGAPVSVSDNVVAFPVLGGLHHDYRRVA